jgi:hypothetical protein
MSAALQHDYKRPRELCRGALEGYTSVNRAFARGAGA